MCLGIPAKIVEIMNSAAGRVETAGVARDISLQLIEDPQVGDWVLIHAGYAINRLDEHEAWETIRLLEELDELS